MWLVVIFKSQVEIEMFIATWKVNERTPSIDIWYYRSYGFLIIILMYGNRPQQITPAYRPNQTLRIEVRKSL